MKPAMPSQSGLARLFATCVILLAGLAACQPEATPAPEAPPAVTVDILPPPTQSPPLPACLEVEGVSLDVQTSARGEARLTVSGLNPAEKATIVFYAETGGHTFKIESGLVASAAGNIEYTKNLGGVDNGFFKQWQIQVIHAQGVACATASLP